MVQSGSKAPPGPQGIFFDYQNPQKKLNELSKKFCVLFQIHKLEYLQIDKLQKYKTHSRRFDPEYTQKE